VIEARAKGGLRAPSRMQPEKISNELDKSSLQLQLNTACRLVS
jgi:hypothetical protein